jgi:catechol 2,3-dioxygenase-like lactoylglutathione lyase family enzyme
MLFRQKEKEKKYINPRFRAYGKARLDIARRAKTRQDWDMLWKCSTNPFPFTWGESWKHCVEYKVDDFAAEVGFFVDILGLPVNAFDPSYAMFTSPGGDFFIGVVPTPEKTESTPNDAIRLQFMVQDIMATTKELERRGVLFEQQPEPCQPGSSLYIGYFRTPHGIPVDLWGYIGEQEDPDHGEIVSDEEYRSNLDLDEEEDRDDIVLDDLEERIKDFLEDEEDNPQGDYDLKEVEAEDLQLQIPLTMESETIEESQKEDQEIADDIESREPSKEAIDSTRQEKDEIVGVPNNVEETLYEYTYEEDPLRDWHIN